MVRVYHDHFVKRESHPRAGATTSRTAASLRPRCNSAILARTRTNTSKRTIGACLVSNAFPIFYTDLLCLTVLREGEKKGKKKANLFSFFVFRTAHNRYDLRVKAIRITRVLHISRLCIFLFNSFSFWRIHLSLLHSKFLQARSGASNRYQFNRYRKNRRTRSRLFSQQWHVVV